MDEDTETLVAFLFWMLLGSFIGIAGGCFIEQEHMRSEAIQHGAARYTCDPETGKTTFEWLTKPKGERE